MPNTSSCSFFAFFLFLQNAKHYEIPEKFIIMSAFKAFTVTKPVCEISWRKPKRKDGKWAKRRKERNQRAKKSRKKPSESEQEEESAVVGPALQLIKDARLQSAHHAPGSVRSVRRTSSGFQGVRSRSSRGQPNKTHGRNIKRRTMGRMGRMSALLRNDLDAETAKKVAKGPKTMAEEIDDAFKRLQGKVEGTRTHRKRVTGTGDQTMSDDMIQQAANAIKANTKGHVLTFKPDKVLKRQGGVALGQQKQQAFVFKTGREQQQEEKKKRRKRRRPGRKGQEVRRLTKRKKTILISWCNRSRQANTMETQSSTFQKKGNKSRIEKVKPGTEGVRSLPKLFLTRRSWKRC